MTTPVTTILQYTILLRVYFCLPVFRGGGYCNCNCNCDCYCDRDCHYNSTIYNSIAGILLATRISMATRLCKILYITLSSHIKVKTTPAFPLHIALPIIPISLQILLILLLVYFFLPAQRARGVIVPSQPTLLWCYRIKVYLQEHYHTYHTDTLIWADKSITATECCRHLLYLFQLKCGWIKVYLQWDVSHQL